MYEETGDYRILIVEDGLLNQYVLKEILKKTYTLQTAATGEEALRQALEFQPHLILLDIILPDKNGFDILSELKNADDTRDIPVIIITGLDSDEDEEKGLFLGAVDYIRKPFKDSIIKARVATQIKIVKQMQTIERMGLIDALTELPNRRRFNSQMSYEWGRSVRDKRDISMLMLDVDKFKNYNDTYGHPQGDVMLQAVAKALRSSLKRSVDIPFRLGGEEFAVLLPGTDLGGAAIVAERIRADIEAMEVPYLNPDTITRITVSIGAAWIQPQAGDSVTEFIERADHQLYTAKKCGRNQVQY